MGYAVYTALHIIVSIIFFQPLYGTLVMVNEELVTGVLRMES